MKKSFFARAIEVIEGELKAVNVLLDVDGKYLSARERRQVDSIRARLLTRLEMVRWLMA